MTDRLGMLGAVALALLAACDGRREQDMPAAPALETVNWPGTGGPPDESGYSPLAQIDATNVGGLGLEWYLDLPGEVTLEATPLAVDGVLYFTGSQNAVYAVEVQTGKLLWRYDPEVWKARPALGNVGMAVNRGAAHADGRIFAGTKDGRLLALDAKTGSLLWSVDSVPMDKPYSITGAPRTFGDKVIIGNGGGDFGLRGFVTAYDAATGRQAWRFYTVPGSPEENAGDPAMERAAATWSGEYWKTGTGGTVWNGMTFDPELNRIYIGTGNSSPYDPSVRSPGGGDNLYLVSIVALDAGTGKYVWHYQMNPREAWDYKATANIILATLNLDGRPRKVLMQAPTNGFYYVLERETGKLLSAEKIGKVTWAERIDLESGRPVEAPDIRYEKGETSIWPGTLGAHNWQAMSFSPRLGLAFIPTMQLGARFYKGPPRIGETSFSGISITQTGMDPDDGKGWLLAWDPAAQQERWRVAHPYLWNGGTLATGGDLVFQGTADGHFSAYDARSGRRLWRFDAGLGIVAAPISYSFGGKQYVSVLVGWGGTTAIIGEILHAGWRYGAQPRRLLTFALDGKSVLPPSPPPDFSVRALDDPALEIEPADVEAARSLYTFRCGVCHGLELVSTGAPGPDLRESAIALKLETLTALLRDGALMQRGMPRFDKLSDEQIRLVHSFIRAGARDALKKQAATGAPAATPASATADPKG
jgi:quinohemoprotein ethanol dehydrogenase